MLDYSNIQTVVGLPSKAYANGDDNTFGPAIDLAGFRKAWVQAVVGTCGANGSFLVMFSDTETGSYTPTDALNGLTLDVATSDTVQSSYMDIPMQKRWMKIMYNHNGAAEIHNAGCLVLLGNPDTTTLVTHVPGYVEEAHSRN